MGSELNPNFELLLQPVRFAGMVQIYRRGGQTTFSDTYRAIGKSPSLWASHVDVLERAGLLETKKSFIGKKLRSEQLLTPRGRKAFEDYIALVNAIASSLKPLEALHAAVDASGRRAEVA
jgi:DNA-binding MarR family transcriptional regulator